MFFIQKTFIMIKSNWIECSLDWNNCTTRISISTLLYSFWNHKQFCEPYKNYSGSQNTPPPQYFPQWRSVVTTSEQGKLEVISIFHCKNCEDKDSHIWRIKDNSNKLKNILKVLQVIWYIVLMRLYICAFKHRNYNTDKFTLLCLTL